MLCSTCVTRKFVGFNNGLPLCEEDRRERRIPCTVCRLRPSSGFHHGVAMCDPDYQFVSVSLGSCAIYTVCSSSCPPTISSTWCHYCRLTACISAKGFRFVSSPLPRTTTPPSSPEPLHVSPRLDPGTGTAHTSNSTHNASNPRGSSAPSESVHGQPSQTISSSSSPPLPSFRVKPYTNPSSHTWTPRPRHLSISSKSDPAGNLPSSPVTPTQHVNLTQGESAVFSRGRANNLPPLRPAINTTPSSSNATHRYYDGSKLGLPNPGRKKRQEWDPAWVQQQQERYLAHHLTIYRHRRLESGAAQSSLSSSRS